MEYAGCLDRNLKDSVKRVHFDNGKEFLTMQKN